MDRDYEDKPLVIYSTPTQLKDFQEGTIWQDMKRELEVWLEMNRDEMEDTEDEKVWKQCRGRNEAIKYMLEMPRVLEATALEDLKIKEKRDE